MSRTHRAKPTRRERGTKALTPLNLRALNRAEALEGRPPIRAKAHGPDSHDSSTRRNHGPDREHTTIIKHAIAQGHTPEAVALQFTARQGGEYVSWYDAAVNELDRQERAALTTQERFSRYYSPNYCPWPQLNKTQPKRTRPAPPLCSEGAPWPRPGRSWRSSRPPSFALVGLTCSPPCSFYPKPPETPQEPPQC